MRIFTDQESVLQAAQPYFFWILILPMVGFACYVWDGIYIGLTASKSMRNSMLLALVVFWGSYYFITPYFQMHGLWFSLVLFLGVRGVFQWFLFSKRGMSLT